jgi:hypothetical protein
MSGDVDAQLQWQNRAVFDQSKRATSNLAYLFDDFQKFGKEHLEVVTPQANLRLVEGTPKDKTKVLDAASLQIEWNPLLLMRESRSPPPSRPLMKTRKMAALHHILIWPSSLDIRCATTMMSGIPCSR